MFADILLVDDICLSSSQSSAKAHFSGLDEQPAKPSAVIAEEVLCTIPGLKTEMRLKSIRRYRCPPLNGCALLT